MKLNTKTVSFKLSLLALVAYIVNIFILRAQLLASISDNPSGQTVPLVFYFLPTIWIGLAGLFFFKATNKQQTKLNQILAFILTPIILSPILAVINVVVLLLPVYDLAGKTLT